MKLLLLGLLLLSVGLQFPPTNNTTQSWMVSQIPATGASPYSGIPLGTFQGATANVAIAEASVQFNIPVAQLQAAPVPMAAYGPRTQLGG